MRNGHVDSVLICFLMTEWLTGSFCAEENALYSGDQKKPLQHKAKKKRKRRKVEEDFSRLRSSVVPSRLLKSFEKLLTVSVSSFHLSWIVLSVQSDSPRPTYPTITTCYPITYTKSLSHPCLFRVGRQHSIKLEIVVTIKQSRKGFRNKSCGTKSRGQEYSGLHLKICIRTRLECSFENL